MCIVLTCSAFISSHSNHAASKIDVEVGAGIPSRGKVKQKAR